MDKYVVEKLRDGFGLFARDPFKRIMATFYKHADAQKVCDLLNETSRSKGIWPMPYKDGQ